MKDIIDCCALCFYGEEMVGHFLRLFLWRSEAIHFGCMCAKAFLLLQTAQYENSK